MSNKKRILNVIIVVFVAIFVLISGGCFNNDNKSPIDGNTEIHTGDSSTNDNDNKNDNQNQNSNTDDTEQNQGENNQNNDNDQNTKTTVNIIGFGDSISAGYAVYGSDMYDSYIAFDNGDTLINDMCYTNIIASKMAQTYQTVNVKSYAKSGDKTSDLVAKLQDETTYPYLKSDIENADVITLCIGANNVLTVALEKMEDYFSGKISSEELEVILQQGVDNFKSDYSNIIIPFLTQGSAKVYVMTVYDPFYYFDVNDITFTSSNQYLAMFAKPVFLNMFNGLKQIAMSYMDQINTYIKAQEIENIIVVDVDSKFKTLTKQEYSLYINADSTKIEINMDDIIDVDKFSTDFTIEIKDATSLQSNPYFDPHPTSLGQKYIANIFLKAMGLDEISLEND